MIGCQRFILNDHYAFHLASIIGPQPAVAELGASEAQNRFNLILQNFLKAISQKEHPFILFLDDLQWADSASLNLLTTLMTDKEHQHFLLIGAYRDNEMDAAHHDLVLAVTSHAPHLIAYTMVGVADDLRRVTDTEVIKYSAAGFRDFTRIAASDPTMWRDVFLNNKEALLDSAARMSEDLARLQRICRGTVAEVREPIALVDIHAEV